MANNQEGEDLSGFMDLPVGSIDNTLKQLATMRNGYFDLENFAGVSPECLQAVQRVHTPLIGFNINSNSEQIELSYLQEGKIYKEENEVVAKQTFRFEPEPFPRFRAYRGYIPSDVMVSKISKDFYTQNDGEEPIRDYEGAIAAVNHIVSLFRKPFLKVKIYVDDLLPNQIPMFLPTDSCERLFIDGTDLIPNDVLKRVITTCKASKRLRCRIPIHENFSMDLSVIQSEVIEFADAHWVSRRALQNLPYRCAKFSNTRLGVRDFESLIAYWYRSRETGNGALFINSGAVTLENLDLGRFKAMPFDDERADRRGSVYYTRPKYGFDCDEDTCVDIRRPDGVLATVSVRNGSFVLLVWNDRSQVETDHHYMRLDE